MPDRVNFDIDVDQTAEKIREYKASRERLNERVTAMRQITSAIAEIQEEFQKHYEGRMPSFDEIIQDLTREMGVIKATDEIFERNGQTEEQRSSLIDQIEKYRAQIEAYEAIKAAREDLFKDGDIAAIEARIEDDVRNMRDLKGQMGIELQGQIYQAGTGELNLEVLEVFRQAAEEVGEELDKAKRAEDEGYIFEFSVIEQMLSPAEAELYKAADLKVSIETYNSLSRSIDEAYAAENDEEVDRLTIGRSQMRQKLIGKGISIETIRNSDALDAILARQKSIIADRLTDLTGGKSVSVYRAERDVQGNVINVTQEELSVENVELAYDRVTVDHLAARAQEEQREINRLQRIFDRYDEVAQGRNVELVRDIVRSARNTTVRGFIGVTPEEVQADPNVIAARERIAQVQTECGLTEDPADLARQLEDEKRLVGTKQEAAIEEKGIIKYIKKMAKLFHLDTYRGENYAKYELKRRSRRQCA